jgi:hypothetical protein
MTLRLTEWGYGSRKIFAIRNGLDLHLGPSASPIRSVSRGQLLDRLHAKLNPPADIGYNAAPVITVTGEDRQEFEVVADPAAGLLTVDEWLSRMGISRDDYLRFDTSGLDDPGRAAADDAVSDYFLHRAQNKRYSDRALVYTADPGTYYPFAAAEPLGTMNHVGDEEIRRLARRGYLLLDPGGNRDYDGIDVAELAADYPYRASTLRDAGQQSASNLRSLQRRSAGRDR